MTRDEPPPPNDDATDLDGLPPQIRRIAARVNDAYPDHFLVHALEVAQEEHWRDFEAKRALAAFLANLLLSLHDEASPAVRNLDRFRTAITHAIDDLENIRELLIDMSVAAEARDGDAPPPGGASEGGDGAG